LNTNKKSLAAKALAVAATLTFVSTPAFAAPFDDDQIINGLSIQLRSDDANFGHVEEWDAVGLSTLGYSTTHAAGEINLIDSTGMRTAGVCIEETAVLTEETDGDVVISCEANQMTGELQGLTVDTEYRLYNLATPNIVMARMLYSVANTTNSSITVPRIEVEYSWDEYDGDWNMLTNNGRVREDTALAGTSTRWISTTAYTNGNVSPDATTFGAAWRADGNSYFTSYDGDVVSDDYISPETENVVVPANSTVMFAFFAVYGSAGQGATPQETSAFMTVLEAQFAVFNQAFTSSSILAKGIANGANVLNWGVVAPAPSPSPSPTTAPAASLAKTGAEVDWLLLGSLIAVVAGAGLFALGRGRRTE
jgi:hypothetical protein